MSVERSVQHIKQPVSTNVLCVDDAQPALELRAHILKARGYHVTTAGNALEAVETFATAQFDLAVLDYEMPAMNGAELAARLKTASPQLKVILYTGATHVMDDELRFIDRMIHKSDGIEFLLAALADFAQCSEQQHRYGTSQLGRA